MNADIGMRPRALAIARKGKLRLCAEGDWPEGRPAVGPIA